MNWVDRDDLDLRSASPSPVSEQAKLPKGVELFYLVRCGECGFIGGPELGHCAKCGYDGIDPASEGIELMRVADAHAAIRDRISPAILAQRDSEWRSGLLGDEAQQAAANALCIDRDEALSLLTAAVEAGAPDGGRESALLTAQQAIELGEWLVEAGEGKHG